MKHLIAIFAAISFAACAYASEPAKKEEPKKAEVKKVCVDKVTKDGKPVMDKDGKQAQDCKEMKVHQKLEGTKVPDKK